MAHENLRQDLRGRNGCMRRPGVTSPSQDCRMGRLPKGKRTPLGDALEPTWKRRFSVKRPRSHVRPVSVARGRGHDHRVGPTAKSSVNDDVEHAPASGKCCHGRPPMASPTVNSTGPAVNSALGERGQRPAISDRRIDQAGRATPTGWRLEANDFAVCRPKACLVRRPHRRKPAAVSSGRSRRPPPPAAGGRGCSRSW